MSGTHLQTGVYKSGRPVKDWQIRRMIKKLRSLCPWIELSDAPILRRWCELEVLCSRAYAALRESGPTNAEGEARRLLNDYRMLVLAQNIIGRELGLSPAARMAIKANRTGAALDVVASMSAQPEDEETPAGAVEEVSDGNGGHDAGKPAGDD